MAANLSDNAGGIAAVDRAATKSRRLKKIWHDSGFKKSFATHCSGSGIASQVVNRVSAHSFEVLPRRWVVERTWAWLVNHRRLRVDYEPDPAVAEGFVWAAHTRVLLRRLTQPGPNPTRRANTDTGRSPTWSPDGTRIAYSNDGIWVMNADGTDPRQLTDTGFSPTWSPDGTRIAYNRVGLHLWVVNADGTNPQQLTE